MIKVSVSGNTSNTDAFLDAMIRGDFYSNMETLAQRGVDALASATPKETGETAEMWSYEIKMGANPTIWWINTHVVNGFHVAIGLQYGHGTGTGGWVQGYDYINPAIKPIMDEIANDMWRGVQNA